MKYRELDKCWVSFLLLSTLALSVAGHTSKKSAAPPSSLAFFCKFLVTNLKPGFGASVNQHENLLNIKAPLSRARMEKRLSALISLL